jgi:hypothetical protein
MASDTEFVVLFCKYTGLDQSNGVAMMSYSVLKMIEYALDYLIRNDLSLENPEQSAEQKIVLTYLQNKQAEYKALAAQLQ